jgi:hypothetical protein
MFNERLIIFYVYLLNIFGNYIYNFIPVNIPNSLVDFFSERTLIWSKKLYL